MKPASEVPIARDHLPFAMYDDARLAAMAEVEAASTEEREYEARLVLNHLGRLQLDVFSDLMASANEAMADPTRPRDELNEFKDWIDGWIEEARPYLETSEARQDELLEIVGRPRAEELLQERVIPEIEGLRDRARVAVEQAASSTQERSGLVADLAAAGPETSAVGSIGRVPEVEETDQIRLRRFTEAERAQYGDDPPDFGFWLIDRRGNETGRPVSYRTEQTLSELLTDQFEDPAMLGANPQGDGWYFMFEGRYFLSAGMEPVDWAAIRESSQGTTGEEQTRAFVANTLPDPRPFLERCIHWAADPEDEDNTFEEVVRMIESDLELADDREEERTSISAIVDRAHSEGFLSAGQRSACFRALGVSSVRRGAIPEVVRHAVWRRDEGRCVQCGSAESLEFDHILPLSRGGSDTERNLQLLCETCNRAKGATI